MKLKLLWLAYGSLQLAKLPGVHLYSWLRLTIVYSINISQGSVATSFRCGDQRLPMDRKGLHFSRRSIVRRNRSCSASDSAYSHTFLSSVVCLSVVCLSHSCTLLKPFDGFGYAIWQVHLWDRMTLCYMAVADPQGKARFGRRIFSQNMQLQTVSPMLPPGEYKRGVGWT